MPDLTNRSGLPAFRDTPLDPRYKNGFYLDQTSIGGRVRARTEGIPNKQLDFLSLNERGELIVAAQRDVLELLTSIRDQNTEILKALMAIR